MPPKQAARGNGQKPKTAESTSISLGQLEVSSKGNVQEQSFELFASTSSHGRLGDAWPHSAHPEIHGPDDAEIFLTELPGPVGYDKLASEDYLGFLDSGNPEGQPTLGALWDELNGTPEPPAADPRRSSSPYTQTERALRSRLLPQSEQSYTQSQHSQRTVAIARGSSQPVNLDDSPPVANAEEERGSGLKPTKAQLTSNSGKRRTKVPSARSVVHNDTPKPLAGEVQGISNGFSTVLSEQKSDVHTSPRRQDPVNNVSLNELSKTNRRTMETSPLKSVKQALNRPPQPSKKKQVAKKPFAASATESVSEQVGKRPTYGIEVQKTTMKPRSNKKIQNTSRGLQENDLKSKSLTDAADPYDVPVSSNDDAPSPNHAKRRKRAAGNGKPAQSKQTKSKGRKRILPESPLSMGDLTDLSADKSWETALTAAKTAIARKGTPESSRAKRPKRMLGEMEDQQPLEQAAKTVLGVKRIKKHEMMKSEQEFPDHTSPATRTSLQKANQGRSHGQKPAAQPKGSNEESSKTTEKPITPIPQHPMEPVLISSDASTQLSDLRDQGRSDDEYLPPMSSPRLLAEKVVTEPQRRPKAFKQVNASTAPCSVETRHPDIISFHSNGFSDQHPSSADKRQAGKDTTERRFKRSEVVKTPFGVSVLSRDATQQAPILDEYSSFGRAAKGVASTRFPVDIDVAASQDTEGSRILNRTSHASSNSMMTKAQGRRANGALSLPRIQENTQSQDCVKGSPEQLALPHHASTCDRPLNKVQSSLRSLANGRASKFEKNQVARFPQKASTKFAENFKSALKMDASSIASQDKQQYIAKDKPRTPCRADEAGAARDIKSADAFTGTAMVQSSHNHGLVMRQQNMERTIREIIEVSPIPSAQLVCGALTCRVRCFKTSFALESQTLSV